MNIPVAAEQEATRFPFVRAPFVHRRTLTVAQWAELPRCPEYIKSRFELTAADREFLTFVANVLVARVRRRLLPNLTTEAT